MKTLFFDLDGTLTDPAPGFVRSLGFALERIGIAPPTPEMLAPFIGPPIQTTLLHFTGGDEAKAAEALVLYRQRYGETGLFENALYPGIVEMLDALAVPGRRMFVATSKFEPFAIRVIEHFGLTRYFGRVFGSRADGAHADKTELLAHALRETGATAQDSVMIGDRRYDALGARANGIMPVGALWGYGSREELAAAGVRGFCRAPAEFIELLQQT